MWGSLTLLRTLLAAGVVDEIRMLVCPVTVGRGTRLFEDRHQLKLVEATGFSNGVTLMRYELAD